MVWKLVGSTIPRALWRLEKESQFFSWFLGKACFRNFYVDWFFQRKDSFILFRSINRTFSNTYERVFLKIFFSPKKLHHKSLRQVFLATLSRVGFIIRSLTYAVVNFVWLLDSHPRFIVRSLSGLAPLHVLDYRWSYNRPTYWRAVTSNWYWTPTFSVFCLQIG